VRRASLSSFVVLVLAVAGAWAAPARPLESTRLTASIVRALADERQPAVVPSSPRQIVARRAGSPRQPLRHQVAADPRRPHALYQRPPPRR
jgi:hypothetical protein